MEKIRTKMDRSLRAKQFMPFDALTGYRELLREKEKIPAQKSELSADFLEELDQRIKQVKTGMIITVIYLKNHEYIKCTGIVSKLDFEAKILKIVNEKIDFCDIHNIIL